MTERASSTLKAFGPWAAVLLSALIAISQFIRADATQTEQMTAQSKRIEQLEEKKADRRELDDLKTWMKRVNDNLDRLNDKVDQRK